MEDANSIRGFRVMPIKYGKSSPTRHLYFKLHHLRGDIDSMPTGRTLFVVCVPPFLNEQNMQQLFSFLGPVEKVIFQQSPTAIAKEPGGGNELFRRVKPVSGYKVAFVIFEDAKSAKQALKTNIDEPILLEEYNISAGVQKWCQLYNDSVIKTNCLQDEIDKFMETFDDRVEEKIQQEKETVGVPDDEGWITVTRQGKKAGIPRTEEKEKKIIANENKKKPRKELQNFYTFQIRESKMEHIVNLRKKFEDDKKRITLMKMARKFRPY